MLNYHSFKQGTLHNLKSRSKNLGKKKYLEAMSLGKPIGALLDNGAIVWNWYRPTCLS